MLFANLDILAPATVNIDVILSIYQSPNKSFNFMEIWKNRIKIIQTTMKNLTARNIRLQIQNESTKTFSFTKIHK